MTTIDRDHALPITRQADLLQISRGSVYYTEGPTSANDRELMRETYGIPLSAARSHHRAAESRVECRHHVHSDAPGLSLPFRRP